jgi:fatty acid/phospholipid biosynthesis enzyme
VVVTDGYSGNVMLKSIEGSRQSHERLLKKAFKRNLFSKIGYLLTKKGGLKEMKEALDPKKTRRRLTHWRQWRGRESPWQFDPEAFKNAMELAYKLSEAGLVEKWIAEG